MNRETQAFIQAMLQREGVCALTKPIRAFSPGDYLRNALGNMCIGFLVPDILFWDPTLLFFLVLCYIALPVRSKDCLSSCIQSGGKTVAGRTTSRVNSMGYETTCFLLAEFMCAKINKKQILSYDSGIICQLNWNFLLHLFCATKLVLPEKFFILLHLMSEHE